MLGLRQSEHKKLGTCNKGTGAVAQVGNATRLKRNCTVTITAPSKLAHRHAVGTRLLEQKSSSMVERSPYKGKTEVRFLPFLFSKTVYMIA